LAARGSDLNAVIHRANPALGNTDKVLRILASQNRALAQLATNSDTVLAPLARERRQISGFVTQANTTSVASAQRARDISRTFRLFPSFLSQLRPLEADLGTLADQGTPVMTELGQSASAVGRQFANLTPFAGVARTALINLGRASAESQASLVATLPLADRLNRLGTAARPTASSLQRLLDSLNLTGGIQQLMSVLYQGASATNGFDSLGHYTRFEPLDSSCTDYVSATLPGCSANFSGAQAAAAGAATAATTATAATAAKRGTKPTAGDRLVAAAVQTASSRSSGAKAMSGLLGYLMDGRR
jgi:ABC-type transporter Mla subunit MlaD